MKCVRNVLPMALRVWERAARRTNGVRNNPCRIDDRSFSSFFAVGEACWLCIGGTGKSVANSDSPFFELKLDFPHWIGNFCHAPV